MLSDTRLTPPTEDPFDGSSSPEQFVALGFRGLVQMMVDADLALLSASPPEQPARA
jgi:hypothetical protein